MPVVAARRPVVIRRRGPVAAVLSALPRGVEAGLAVGRLRAIWLLLGLFLALNLLVRLGLAVFNGDPSLWWPWRLLPALAIGALFDLGRRRARTGAPGAADRPLAAARRALDTMARGGWWQRCCCRLCVLLVFVAFSEFTFWNEFASRFNFIAVDYLIYTKEVIGNIRESYNLPLLLSAVAAARAAALGAGVARCCGPSGPRRPPAGKARGTAMALWVLLLAGRGLLGRRCALQGVLAQCAAQ